MRALLELDGRLSAQLSLAERPGPLRNIAAVLAHSGDSWFWFIGLGLVWIFGDQLWRQRVQVFLVGILITAVLVLVIKFSIKRRRPEGEWGRIYRSTDPHSFPSGHAARAMLLAMLAIGLGPAWLTWALVVWSPLVVLARVAMGVHYLSDVVAGGLLGILIGVVILGFI
ncbi:MAG: phosphatase PAP2 family protein [Anaerolineales bacterium]|nr:MAG: phosphatase PAP2 family protein [Anaerolineales bacterium]